MSDSIDNDILFGELPKNKLTKEVALTEFKRFLSDRGLLKKAAKRSQSDEETKNNFESAKDIIIGSIMDGSIVISNDNPSKLIHTLTDPPKDSDGNPLYETLEYGFIPSLIKLKQMDRFKNDESIGRTQALIAAMTNKSIVEIGQISSADLDVIAAIAFFLT